MLRIQRDSTCSNCFKDKYALFPKVGPSEEASLHESMAYSDQTEPQQLKEKLWFSKIIFFSQGTFWKPNNALIIEGKIIFSIAITAYSSIVVG